MVESINVIVDDLGSRSRKCDEDRIDVSKEIELIKEKSEDEKLRKKIEKSKERNEIGRELSHQRKISQRYLKTIH